ncbi:hypothetical protein [Mycobacterium sp.]|uniref:hypothetical protein n=1 Tax=Mycobacterium sp. TaxID=1785 RepID=UPI0025E0FEC0|nr:hypothetical protein [Mycobacterium sp.]
MAQSSAAPDWTPTSCTLPTTKQPLRLAEFDAFFRSAVRSSTRSSATRLDLVVDGTCEATARDLAERESSCCSFFAFTFDNGRDGVVMTIGVPDDRVDVLDVLHARIATVGGNTTNGTV